MNYIKTHSAMELAYEQAQDDYLNIGIRCNIYSYHPFLGRCYDLGWKDAQRDHGAICDLLNRQAKHSKADDIKSPPVPVASVRRRRTFGLRGSSHHGAAH